MKPKAPFKPVLLVLVLLWMAGLACSLAAPTPAAWALTPTAKAVEETATAFAASQQAADVPLATITPSETPTPLAPTATVTVGGLLPSGPWLLYTSDEGKALVLLNADGSGRTVIPISPLLDTRDLQDGLSPQGSWLAIRTRQGLDNYGLNLDLIHLPDGKMERITPLVAADLQERAKSAPNSHPEEALKAAAEPGALSWSPDGRYLAFIAVIEGISSDLYIYDLQTKKIERITTGSSQVATPSWSPDGNWLVAQEVERFGDGSAWQVNKVWGNKMTFREVRDLYTPSAASQGEVFLGWTALDKMLVYSRSASGGFAIRMVDLEKLKVSELFPGAFDEIAFDLQSKTLALIFNAKAGVKTDQAPGLYLMQVDETVPRQAQAGEWHHLSWQPRLKMFTAAGPQGALTVALAGTFDLVKNETSAVLSPNKSWQVSFTSSSGEKPGVRLYKAGGELMQTISSDAASALVWQPDSNGFFYLANDRLYLVTFPQFKPRLVDANVQQGSASYLDWLFLPTH
jgi:dipeptidyl aminopeptidase/acylaminoacyl peptidase